MSTQIILNHKCHVPPERKKHFLSYHIQMISADYSETCIPGPNNLGLFFTLDPDKFRLLLNLSKCCCNIVSL